MCKQADLKQSFIQLLLLIMLFKTSMSTSSMIIHNTDQLQYFKDLQDTRDVHTIVSVPTFEQYYFHTEHENIMKYKTNKLIVSSVESLNKHYMTMVSTRGSKLSSASKITNLCRDVFLGKDVQKLIQNPHEEITSIFYTKEVTNLSDFSDVNYETLCEMSFPIPRLYINAEENMLKLEITNSMSYSKIAEMLELLYEDSDSNHLDSETNIKISKLKFLIKKVRFIEDSARENTDDLQKIHNICTRVTNFFSTFDEIEDMFGDPELHFESIRKGLKNAFDTKLINQQTQHNEIIVRAVMDSYILPFFGIVASVADPSVDLFTKTVNKIITGFNFDTHLYNLIYIAMGTIFSCIAVFSCLKENKTNSILMKEIEMLQQQKVNHITRGGNSPKIHAPIHSSPERKPFTRSQKTGIPS
jgi:hypothetical protein